MKSQQTEYKDHIYWHQTGNFPYGINGKCTICKNIKKNLDGSEK